MWLHALDDFRAELPPMSEVLARRWGSCQFTRCKTMRRCRSALNASRMTSMGILTAALLLVAALPSPGYAESILLFGGSPGAITAVGDATTGVTTIDSAGGSTGVTITSIGGVSETISAFLNLAATSSGTAADNGGVIQQNFNGTFAITQNANGTGINYLSGSFSGLTFGFGGGSVATLTASDPPSTVTFTSSFSPSLPLDTPRGASFTFSNVSPALGIVGTDSHETIASFTAQGSGTFSAAVPEPSSLTLAGIGVLGLVGIGLRQRKATSR
jgi:PEP-CTERM motif